MPPCCFVEHMLNSLVKLSQHHDKNFKLNFCKMYKEMRFSLRFVFAHSMTLQINLFSFLLLKLNCSLPLLSNKLSHPEQKYSKSYCVSPLCEKQS